VRFPKTCPGDLQRCRGVRQSDHRKVDRARLTDGLNWIDGDKLEHVELITPPAGCDHVLSWYVGQGLIDQLNNIGTGRRIKPQVKKGIDHSRSAADVAVNGLTQVSNDGFQIELANSHYNVSMSSVVSDFGKKFSVAMWHQSYPDQPGRARN